MTSHIVRPATFAAALLTVGLTACGSGSNGSSPSSAASPATSTPTTATTTAATAQPAGAAPIAVKLSDYKVEPASATATAGHVEFDVSNTGKIKHQFTIIRTNKSAADVLSKQNPDDDIPGARGEIASIAPGARKTLDIKKLKPGHYAIVCALPGHYQSGMFTDFTVK